MVLSGMGGDVLGMKFGKGFPRVLKFGSLGCILISNETKLSVGSLDLFV